jgi:uncharacterized protein (DUF2141 family)
MLLKPNIHHPAYVRAAQNRRAFVLNRKAPVGALVNAPDFSAQPLERRICLSAVGSTIVGRAFWDINNNGSLNAGETPIAGARAFLDANDNQAFDPGELSALSGADGSYTIDDVPTGFWWLRHVAPDGYTVQSSAAGVTFTDVDQTYGPDDIACYQTGSLCWGSTYADKNGNNTRDPGETPLAGVRVYVDANDNNTFDAGELSCSSSLGGNWGIQGVQIGTWKVLATPKQGYQPNAAAMVTFTADGQDSGELKIGSTPVTKNVSGRVFWDINNNGNFNAGESPLESAIVFIDADNSGTMDPGERSATTDAAGNYTIGSVPPGTWSLRQLPPAGFTGSGAPLVITLTDNGPDSVNNDFADTQTGASVFGQLFIDSNGNGTLDAGEAPTHGVIYVDANNNQNFEANELSCASLTGGGYAIKGLQNGTWNVRQVARSGFATPGIVISVTAPNQLFERNFANVPLGSISGTVFNDANGNRVKDSNEAGLSSRTVYLDLDNDRILDANEKRTTTSAAGAYTFANLPAGSYKVREVIPSGWSQTTPTDNFGHTLTLHIGQNLAGQDFGARAVNSASIAGNVFHDFNRNRVKDSNDSGLSGWTVYLDKDNDSILDSNETRVTTDSAGNYIFNNLAAGTYKIRIVRKAGYIQTTPTNNFGNNATLTSGQKATGENFGADN